MAEHHLPPLVFDRLPTPVRDSLIAAYNNARAHPEDGSVIGRVGMLLHATDEFGLAREYYQLAWQLDPNTMSWPYLAGIVQSEVGDNKAAIAAFRAALAIDRAYLPARIRLADALLADGDRLGSRTDYQGLVRSFPELAVGRYGFARVLVSLGQLPVAIIQFQRAVELAPQFGAAHYGLALAYRDRGLIEPASRELDAYRQFSAFRPTVTDPVLDEARTLTGTAKELVAEATRLRESGRLNEAITGHLQAAAADPTAAQGRVNSSALYGLTARPDAAERQRREVLRLNHYLADAHYHYGVLRAALGRYTEAADAFRLALGVDPFHVRANNNLAALLARQGKREEAAERYRQVLASDPQHQAARLGLGQLLAAMGRPRQAIEHLQMLLVPEGRETPRYLSVLAITMFAAGHTRQALIFADRAQRDAERLEQTELADTIRKEVEKMKGLQK